MEPGPKAVCCIYEPVFTKGVDGTITYVDSDGGTHGPFSILAEAYADADGRGLKLPGRPAQSHNVELTDAEKTAFKAEWAANDVAQAAQEAAAAKAKADMAAKITALKGGKLKPEEMQIVLAELLERLG